MATGDHPRETCFYHEWMNLQEQELAELKRAMTHASEGLASDEELGLLINSILSHFESYIQNRAQLAQSDVYPYFSPPWCSVLERSVMWIGGCRPSSYIRLLHALKVEAGIAELISGEGLVAVDELQRRTVAEEMRLSTKAASLQEDVLDMPLVGIAVNEMGQDCGPRGEVGAALGSHDEGMKEVLWEADQLRMTTLTELLKLMRPQDAVSFLATGKKIKLCLQQWGRESDREHGRN